MTRGRLLSALVVLGVVGGCGPDKRPEPPCDGPSFNLVVTAEDGPLPPDTRINVRYGSNQEGEPYELDGHDSPQAVFCEQDTSTVGGGDVEGQASEGGAAGAGGTNAEELGVQALRCRLYTQGPASLDATATGYQPIKNLPLSFVDTNVHCQVEIDVKLERELLDAGK